MGTFASGARTASGKGVERNLITPQVFLGHVLCGFGQQSRHCTSCWGVLWLSGQQEKKDHQCHVCHWPTRNTACHVTLVLDSHNDLYNISEVLRGLLSGLKVSDLFISRGFLNADAGFDAEQFRRVRQEHEVFPNVTFNKRRGM